MLLKLKWLKADAESVNAELDELNAGVAGIIY